MLLEVIHGETAKNTEARALEDQLVGLVEDGTLYIGYPVLSTADVTVEIDALLLFPGRGPVAFILSQGPLPNTPMDWKVVADTQDQVFFALDQSLRRHESLRRGREFLVDIHAVTVFPGTTSRPAEVHGSYVSIGEVGEFVTALPELGMGIYPAIKAAVDRVTTIRPKKRRALSANGHSRGAIIEKVDSEIANLDQWQQFATIETVAGPQRIRGLAGSGKTIVLALKAAYLHSRHPDWTIALTFFTRSLYEQFKDLIRRFTFEHINDEPDWTKLRLLHAWGSNSSPGIYSEIAKSSGFAIHNFATARREFGRDNAFEGACRELLTQINQLPAVETLFDVVLIDEAQDLPQPFFELVYQFTKDDKRIVFAYDELQQLSETGMPSAGDLFGRDDDQRPRVELNNRDGQPHEDINLKICYRNTPWALTLAHGLGFGLMREP
ncbi:MAG: AAA family ATPase, partial [Chloroflexi bacterium]|nr:AAA family ATPase [Chloroflexota bacterium]